MRICQPVYCGSLGDLRHRRYSVFRLEIIAVSQFRVCILRRTFAVFEGESFRETLLTLIIVVTWDGLAFRAFPGCVTSCFTLTKVISAAQACDRGDLCHALLPFSLFLSPFSGAQRILEYVRPRRTAAVHPPKRGKRRSIWRSLRIGTAFVWRCDVISLQMLLRRMQTLNWDTAYVWRLMY